MTKHDLSSGFAARPRAIEPAFRGRTKIATFEHGATVAEMLRDLLTREFPDTHGGCS